MLAAAPLSLFALIVPSPHDCGAKSDTDEGIIGELHLAVLLILIALPSLTMVDHAPE